MKLTPSSRFSAVIASLVLSLFIGTSVSAEPLTKAQIDEIARSNGWVNSDYPYYENVNRCGGEDATRNVPDNYRNIPFSGACDSHDRCYMSFDANKQTCDERFYSELRASCEKNSYHKVLGKKVRNPLLQGQCYSMATVYYTGVVTAGELFFPGSQEKARKYKEFTDPFTR